MKPVICTAILFLLSAAFLVFHEMLMQTWRPMFILILIAFSIALALAFSLFRRADKHSESRAHAIRLSCFAVFIFTVAWSLLWAFSEQGPIHYYIATYGPDDTGGRYFYPGNSGMGYARGLSRPLDLLGGVAIRGIIFAALLGIPLGFLFRTQTTNSEQADAGNRAKPGA